MKHRIICAVLVVFITTGCQSSPPTEASPYYRIPAGSTLTVNESLSVPNGSSHVFLQGGKVVGVNAVSRFDPSCSFKVMGPLDSTRTIEPGVFEISGYEQFRRPFGLDAGAAGVQVAQFGFRGGMFDQSREIVFITTMRLSSAQQADVRELTCKVTTDPLGTFVTLEQIRQTLGSVATIDLQGG